MSATALRTAVLISGSGSNLQAFIDRRAELGLDLAAVVSDQPEAYGLERARRADIARVIVEPERGEPRADYDARLHAALAPYSPSLLLLAGFMRILSPAFVHRYAGRMLNVHPSLLPAYRGLHTHRRVLAAGEPEHGCSVHFVTDELDGGPVVARARVRIEPGDDEQTLSARVQAREHKLFPLVAGWYAAGRLGMRGATAWLDGRQLLAPVCFAPDEEIA